MKIYTRHLTLFQVKRLGIVLIITFLALSACRPSLLRIGLPEEAPEGLVGRLDSRRNEFSNMIAMSRVSVERKGRKRAFDSVGVIIDGSRRLKIEAYGPLGGPLVTLLWLGAEPVISMGGERVFNAEPAGVERLLGMNMDVSELNALLSGNVPESALSGNVRAFCGASGECALETRRDGVIQRSWIDTRAGTQGLLLTSYELYENGGLVYRARFEQPADISGYIMPMKIIIENPNKKASLTVEYNDVEVNTQIRDDYFSLPEDERP